jgi:hypothetical protein
LKNFAFFPQFFIDCGPSYEKKVELQPTWVGRPWMSLLDCQKLKMKEALTEVPSSRIFTHQGD